MTTPIRISHRPKIITIYSIAIACLGISGCASPSQSEKEFAAQNGFKRSDYFGTTQGDNFVPSDVKNYNQ
jgi:hypothetical protein